MSRDKQIEEMAHCVCEGSDGDICTLDRKQCDLKCTIGDIAKRLYNKGYRKIYDDNQRQCACYAFCCIMAEQLERKVAEKIFAEIDEMVITEKSANECAFYLDMTELAELKKKYKEGGKEQDG